MLRRSSARVLVLLGLCLALTTTSCGAINGPPPTAPGAVTLTIQADGNAQEYQFTPGLTVRDAIAHAGLAMGELDRLTPPPYTVIANGMLIVITRVTESTDVEQVPLPYSSETVRNETLAEGERRLLQVGQAGIEEITYRTVLENGIQVSRSVVRRVTLSAPVPEIIMVGTQGSFTLVPITGTVAYLNGRNAWIMRGNSGQRLPLTISGDLDGHVFQLSNDGQWLLFTREITNSAASFNGLWVVPTAQITPTRTVTRTNPVAVRVPVTNVLYAEWSPVTPRLLAFTTADRISRAPGWQANNNLWLTTFNERPGSRNLVFTSTRVLDSSSGGAYGWWGTGFAFAPDGASIAYARTDSIGLLDVTLSTKKFTVTVSTSELLQFTAYNTHSDWAWYPPMRWAPDGHALYTITHGAPIGLEAAEDSPAFDLTALLVPAALQFKLIPRSGMFANPVPSPLVAAPDGTTSFRVAFLQATDPNNSPFTTYRLGVIDRDGSNLRFVFPPEGQPGLSANQAVAWSPDGQLLAVVYDGNLWLVNPDTGQTQQLTGDGLATTPRWSR
ncbi:MAG: G5 domain-containing protein [Anaerolineales bacterium]